MPIFDGKKIFLALPKNNGFEEVFRIQLTNLGFDVTICSLDSMSKFKYSSVWQRVYNTFRKICLNDYAHKQELIQKFREKLVLEDLPKLENSYDYVLFIRPDMFPIELFELLSSRTSSMIGYQWDGFSRYPVDEKRLNYFDRFFVFDPDDMKPSFLPLTNFYIDPSSADECNGKALNKSFRSAFFIGGYEAERMAKIKQIKDAFNSIGFDDKFLFFSHSKSGRKVIERNGMDVIDKIVNYYDMLPMVWSADVLVDVVSKDHMGLSFRTFEALGYGKKLVTTNAMVKFYDFYRPENIFIWNDGDVDNLAEFLNTPMVLVSKDILRKYEFVNWIKYVLNYGDYI
ncbi:hypothetical protein ACFSQ3_03965 [Sphingobacterium corticis]|uniref:Glycosyltransferase family 1 protein n=1 Tax=Sphingobacterium corticis TaxID=1812823 RepID=A0ABW5NGX4_9SPHI